MVRPRAEIDLDELKRLYVQERLSLDAVAERLGVGATTVRSRLEEAGVRRRPTNAPTPRGDDDEVRRLYTEGLGSSTIAARLGRPDGSVTAQLRRLGVKMRPWRAVIDPGWLRCAYVDEQRSMRSIAVELGYKEETIARALDRLGIPRGRHRQTPPA